MPRRSVPPAFQLDRSQVERIAKIIGPLSAATKALACADEHAAAGRAVEFWQVRRPPMLLLVPVEVAP